MFLKLTQRACHLRGEANSRPRLAANVRNGWKVDVGVFAAISRLHQWATYLGAAENSQRERNGAKCQKYAGGECRGSETRFIRSFPNAPPADERNNESENFGADQIA